MKAVGNVNREQTFLASGKEDTWRLAKAWQPDFKVLVKTIVWPYF